MRLWQALVSLWPGGLWLVQYGAASGFWLASGFAVLLNGAIYCQWIAPDNAAGPVRIPLWIALGAYWVWAKHWERRRWEQAIVLADEGADDLLRKAQRAFLKRDWSEAERLLRCVLAMMADDIEARLLLASVLRRAGRQAEAWRQLRRAEQTVGSTRWQWEIHREYQLLRTLGRNNAVEPPVGSSIAHRAGERSPAGNAARQAA